LDLLFTVIVTCISRLFDSHFFVYVIEGDVVEAVVPHMGESITDGTLAAFLKSMLFFTLSSCSFLSGAFMYLIFSLYVLIVLAEPGDRVEADEAIAQIETDKVSNNYLSYYLHSNRCWSVSCVAFLILVFDSSMCFRLQ